MYSFQVIRGEEEKEDEHDLTEKVSVSTNPTDCILNGRPQTFFTLLQKIFLYTRMCASANRECERAHASDALPTRESKLVSAKLKNTREYSQTNTQVLAIVIASTCNQTLQYSQSNLRVLAIIRVGNNFCGVSCNRINKLWCTCGMVIRGKLVPETRCNDYITSICLPTSFFTNEISEKIKPKIKKIRLPAC